jgi:hypothetical protein
MLPEVCPVSVGRDLVRSFLFLGHVPRSDALGLLSQPIGPKWQDPRRPLCDQSA